MTSDLRTADSGPIIGSLFSGFDGLAMGIHHVIGGTTAWVSDIDPGACKILAHRYPDAPNLGDVALIDWTTVTPVDVLIGGFPCQDVSHAGKQAGMLHGTRSGLWHEFARAIDALRPELVVIENVRGLLSARGDTSDEYETADQHVTLTHQLHEWVDTRRERALTEGRTDDARRLTTRAHRIMGLRRRAVADRRRAERRIVRAIGTVLGTLADLGYDARWHGLRAADVGAPHGRFRVFIVAYPRGEHSLERWVAAPRETEGGRSFGEPARCGGAPVEQLLGTPQTADGMRSPMRDPAAIIGQGRGRLEDQVALLGTPQARDGKGAGPNEERWEQRAAKRHLEEQLLLLPTPRAGDGEKGGPNQRGSSGDMMLPSAVLLPTPTSVDALGSRNLTARRSTGGEGVHIGDTLTDFAWKHDGHNDARMPANQPIQGWGKYGPAVARWAHLTRPAPPPTELNSKGAPRLSARFSEWMMGCPDGWITDVPGITRNEALKACGNGVVWQQAAYALTVLLTMRPVIA